MTPWTRTHGGGHGWILSPRRPGGGVAICRARIVSEPISEYIQFEHGITFANVVAGEDIRWLPRRQASRLLMPGSDFSLMLQPDRGVFVIAGLP
jgi:hypothetical protein